MGKRPLRHHSFIFTLWQETEATADSPAEWRFRLENPHSSERRGFKNLDELFAYLQKWTDDQTKEVD